MLSTNLTTSTGQYDRVEEVKQHTLDEVSKLDEKLQMYRFICISGFIGATATTFAKSCADLLQRCFAGENQFVYAFTWVVLLGWIHIMGYVFLAPPSRFSLFAPEVTVTPPRPTLTGFG